MESCLKSKLAPKLERKYVEKNRRNHMKNLCNQLHSMLPIHPSTSKETTMAVPDQIDAAVKYIESLKMKLEKNKKQLEELKMGQKRSQSLNATNEPGPITKSAPEIEFHEMGPNMVVVLITSLYNIATSNNIIRLCHEEGVEVGSTSFKLNGNSTLQISHEPKVMEKNGETKWKRVEVNIEDHVKTLVFPNGQPLSFYDDYFSNYLSKLASDPFPENRPMWEIHILKFPTSNAAGSTIFRLHHSLGDGYSLMGALLSCLQRVDNPSLPLTFPSRKKTEVSSEFEENGYTILNRRIQHRAVNIVKCVPRAFMNMVNTIQDFGRSVLRSTLIEDDRTPIRSGYDGVEFRPIKVITATFSLDSIKKIKEKLKVTINDVVTGIVTHGTRLYMEGVNKETSNGKCTALVLFNTRAIGGYKSVSDMLKPNSEMPWGNHFTFLPVPLPKLNSNDSMNPLEFVINARSFIQRQTNSASVFLTGKLLEILRKVEGPEATAKYIHATLKHTSMGMTNLIGPIEEMSLADHPIKGLYFVVAGAPQSLSVTMLSYVDKLRIAIVVEKDFIDPNKLKSCIEYSFETIFNVALNSSSLVET